MNKEQTVFTAYEKYNDCISGKAYHEATNIQNTLRNKIRSGIMTASSKEVTPITPVLSSIMKEPNTELKVSERPTFPVSIIPTGLNLSCGSLDVNPNASCISNLWLPSSILAPLSSRNKVLLNEKRNYSIIKLAFSFQQYIQILDVHQTETVLQLRHSIIQLGVFPTIRELSGWRLCYQGQLLNDSSFIYTFDMQSGSVLDLINLENDIPISPPSFTYNSFNAATYRTSDYPGHEHDMFVRTIERSTHPSTTGTLPIAIHAQTDVKTAPTIVIERQLRIDYFPVLHRHGYYMRPSHFDMRMMQEDDIRQVNDFIVGREGVGEICWLGVTDVRRLNLDDRIIIEFDLNQTPRVHVYPSEIYLNVLPPIGQELNKPAYISLFNMFPRGIRNEDAIVRYTQMLKRQVNAMEGKWIDYNIHTGVLQFGVDHFLNVC